jgi:hypothetical protein
VQKKLGVLQLIIRNAIRWLLIVLLINPLAQHGDQGGDQQSKQNEKGKQLRHFSLSLYPHLRKQQLIVTARCILTIDHTLEGVNSTA